MVLEGVRGKMGSKKLEIDVNLGIEGFKILREKNKKM